MYNLRRRALSRPVVASALVGATVFALSNLSAPAFAGEELLVRKSVNFHECKAHVMAVPASLGARPDRVSVVRDTGAEFRLKIAAVKANLVMGCNKVSDQMEVYRTTPGDAGTLASLQTN